MGGPYMQAALTKRGPQLAILKNNERQAHDKTPTHPKRKGNKTGQYQAFSRQGKWA